MNELSADTKLWRLNIESKAGKLTRRQGMDAMFMRELWANRAFMQSFHRLSRELPSSDEHLVKVLNDEYTSPIERSRAVHWVIRDGDDRPWGLLSLTDVSLLHRRAEVLLGVLPEAPFGLATASMLMLFNYYFNALKFNKLYSLVFADNEHSLKGTLHLGFKQEGLLKSHTFDPVSQSFSDLIQTGLLKTDAFSPSNMRLMDKLLKKPERHSS